METNLKEEFEDEDEYLKELQTKLIQAKHERKKTEKEADILDNRLNKLKIEEENELKKIENISKKVQEKIEKYKFLSNNINQQNFLKQIKQAEIEEKKIKNQKMKEEIKKNIETKKNERSQQVKEEAKLFKLYKQYNENLKEVINSENFKNNKTKWQIIKGQHILDKERKIASEYEKKLKLRDELKQRLIREIELRDQAKAEKDKVEQEEMEYMKKLQTTTQIHKYSKLQYIIIIITL